MDNQVHNAIVSFIWGIADDCLRDVYVRGKYRDVILPMTVIRRLDAMLEDTKEEVLYMKKKMDAAEISNQWPALCNAAGQAFCNSSPFLLKDLTSRAKKQTLKVDFEAYLDGFSPNVQEILEKFKFRNQIATMIDADILGAVIEKFISPDINLSPKNIYRDDSKKEVRLPALDNHGMGTVFEELIRKFNEDNNEEAGEHWTPRDVVELMADLVFEPIKDKIKDATYSCYDGACGTGGMLTVAQDRLMKLAGDAGKKVSIHLFGQELQPETYAICKADMLLKGDGEQADHIAYGSTLSSDGNATRQFDFMLSNPPYGKSWKTDAEKLGGKKDILDSRFNAYLSGDIQLAMLPKISDGQLLFLLNNVAKMKKETAIGSRIAEVHNASSLFSGDAGSGESNARRYMIEQDLVEAIIALPDSMFYNTSLGTYIWILCNKKEEGRKGKIQLIDASGMKAEIKKKLGDKKFEITPEIREQIIELYLAYEQADDNYSKVFRNEEFGYYSVTINRPLRLEVTISDEKITSVLKEDSQLYELMLKMQDRLGKETMYNYNTALSVLSELANKAKIKLTAKRIKLFRSMFTANNEVAEPVLDSNGEHEADKNIVDVEKVPLLYKGGIEAFFETEILPYSKDAWIDRQSITIGYELGFTEHFYKPTSLRNLNDIVEDIMKIEKTTDGLLTSVFGGVSNV